QRRQHEAVGQPEEALFDLDGRQEHRAGDTRTGDRAWLSDRVLVRDHGGHGNLPGCTRPEAPYGTGGTVRDGRDRQPAGPQRRKLSRPPRSAVRHTAAKGYAGLAALPVVAGARLPQAEVSVHSPGSPIREIAACDESIRREMISAARPAVFRGLGSAWPAVAAGRQSAAAMVEYLRRFDSGHPVDAIMTPPEIEGRIFYDADLSGFNFVRNRLALSVVAEQALRYSSFERAPAVAAQSALISECLPGFAAQNRLGFLDDTIVPRIWLGTAITTPTHLDEWNNIGCVVSGRRRFTLFPPEQVANLYVGPLDFAPTGAPMSLVRLHHVESLESFNVLINYWWHSVPGTPVGSDSGFDTLLHAILNVRSLPPETRAAWRALFEHYVFGDQTGVTG